MTTKKCFTKKRTDSGAAVRTSTPRFCLKRYCIEVVAKWLHRLTEPTEGNSGVGDLHLALDTWLQKRLGEHDDLVIGFVECKKCNSAWETLAYRSTVNRLQCPKCNAKHTRGIGAVYNNQVGNNK